MGFHLVVYGGYLWVMRSYPQVTWFAHYEIARIARISGDRITAYLKEYDAGGLARIGVLRTYCPVSVLLPYQDQIKAYFQKHPPHCVSQAAHEIEKPVGIKLALTHI